MHIDFKMTTWERVIIPECFQKEIEEAILLGDINDPNDLYNYFDDPEWEKLIECDEHIKPKDNGNEATIEAYDSYNKEIWNNKSKTKENG